MYDETIQLKDNWSKRAHIQKEEYEKMYNESISDPEKFWGEQAQSLKWIELYSKVKNTSFEAPVNIEWFKDGKLNISDFQDVLKIASLPPSVGSADSFINLLPSNASVLVCDSLTL